MRSFTLAVLIMLSSMPSTAGRWDGAYTRKGALTPNNSSVNIAVPKGSYVSVECPSDAYVGVGEGSGVTCSATTCRNIKFSLGEKFYAQLQGSMNYVAVFATTSITCQVFYNQ